MSEFESLSREREREGERSKVTYVVSSEERKLNKRDTIKKFLLRRRTRSRSTLLSPFFPRTCPSHPPPPPPSASKILQDQPQLRLCIRHLQPYQDNFLPVQSRLLLPGLRTSFPAFSSSLSPSICCFQVLLRRTMSRTRPDQSSSSSPPLPPERTRY